MSSLNLSVSPHIHGPNSTRNIMLDVIIALLPTTIAGVIIFGLRSLAVIAACLIGAVLSEFLYNLAVKKSQTIDDLSAVVTGLLLALNLPANIPIWQAVVGSVFAIILVKCIFGGLGCNFVNPAITARVFMLVAFGSMTKAAFPDTTTSATPLAELAEDKLSVSLLDLFLGKNGGAIGEVCALALLIGGIYLVARKVITLHIPLAFIATVFVLSFLLDGFSLQNALAWTLSGGVFIGAFFMATDYVTSPSTPLGKIIFGVFAGLITVVIRFYGGYPEGVSFGILLANIINPYIENIGSKKVFGGAKA